MSENGLKVDESVDIPRDKKTKGSSETIDNQSTQQFIAQTEQLDLIDESKVIFFSSYSKYSDDFSIKYFWTKNNVVFRERCENNRTFSVTLRGSLYIFETLDIIHYREKKNIV